MLFGLECRLPIVMIVDIPPTHTPTTGAEYLRNLAERYSRIFTYTRNHQQTVLIKERERNQRMLGGPVYRVGDLCYYYSARAKPGLSQKLQRKWYGPMVVERIVSPSLVILRHRDATSKDDARIPAVINKTRKIDENFIPRMLTEPPPPWTEEDDLEDEVDLFFPKPEEMNPPSSQLTPYAPPLMNSSAPPPDTDLTEDDTLIGGGGMPPLKDP